MNGAGTIWQWEISCLRWAQWGSHSRPSKPYNPLQCRHRGACRISPGCSMYNAHHCSICMSSLPTAKALGKYSSLWPFRPGISLHFTNTNEFIPTPPHPRDCPQLSDGERQTQRGQPTFSKAAPHSGCQIPVVPARLSHSKLASAFENGQVTQGESEPGASPAPLPPGPVHRPCLSPSSLCRPALGAGYRAGRCILGCTHPHL